MSERSAGGARPRGRGRARAAGLLIGFALDRGLGDPRRGHPVAAFGTLAGRLEHCWHAPSRARGALHCAVLVGGCAGLGAVAVRAARGRSRPGLAEAALTAAATWTVLGGRSLDREAAAVERLLLDGDLPAARARLRHLVGRRTDDLSADEVARAAIESVAENTSDAVVAPLVWGAVAGVPGLLGYRAANTLDAMVGHRSQRYERFGWASARLDDAANLPGARLCAALAAVLAPSVGGSPGAALRAWRRDAGAHPSPNAGPVEAAFAGALGVRLGGRNTYGDRVEDRHRLGNGPPPRVPDVRRATALARRIDTGAVALAAIVSGLGAARAGRRGGA